jgi:hypothetical protein
MVATHGQPSGSVFSRFTGVSQPAANVRDQENGAQERHRITCSPLIAIARLPLSVPDSFAAGVAYLFVDDRV